MPVGVSVVKRATGFAGFPPRTDRRRGLESGRRPSQSRVLLTSIGAAGYPWLVVPAAIVGEVVRTTQVVVQGRARIERYGRI